MVDDLVSSNHSPATFQIAVAIHLVSHAFLPASELLKT